MTQQLMLKSTAGAWYLEQSVNHLLRTEEFDDVIWKTFNCTVTAGQTDPNAGSTAAKITADDANARFYQPVEFLGGTMNRTFSLYVKRITGTGDIDITVDGVTFETIVVTGSFVRYDTTLPIGGDADVGVRIKTSGDEIVVAFAQVENGKMSVYTKNGENEYVIFTITDTDYPINTVRGCVFLDGRFFVMTPSGEIQQSALEDASSWAALDFIQSQIDAGRGVFLSRMKNYIVAFKDWSTEFFYDAANSEGSILSPVQNAAFQIGCASDGSVQEMSDTICWMGQTKVGFGRGIYALQGTEAQKFSTPAVDKILDADDLSEVHSWSATVGPHSLYGITLVSSKVTLAYDFSSQVWSFFTSLTAINDPLSISSISVDGKVTTATNHGLSDGAIVKISDVNDDFNGWHISTDITSDTVQIQSDGTAVAGFGSLQRYKETWFPIVSSVRAEGRQYMQDAVSGALYEFSQNVLRDGGNGIAMRIRTPKIDDGSSRAKTMGPVELVGDKVPSVALVRHSDDDYGTNSNFRPVDLGAKRSRIRRVGKTNRRSFEILHVGDALVRLEAIEIGE